MEEMLDTFDREGNFLGVKPKIFCQGKNPGCYHRHVWIWIVDNAGNILVQKRSKYKKHGPGLWDMPSAGHVQAGEDYLTACHRETLEELGIDIPIDRFQFKKEIINDSSFGFSQIFLLVLNDDEMNFALQVEEVEKVQWLKKDEFKKLIYSDEFIAHDIEYKDWVVNELLV